MEKKLNVFDKIKLSMDLDDPRRKNVELMEKVVNTIPTAAGKKYALSKLLNDPEYGLTAPSEFKNQDYIKDIEDAWSLRHQEDYTPPDVEKVIEKRNQEDAENFWNWDSDGHWTKKGTDELKRQAKDAGYADFGSYLDKVREIQTDKDTKKELSKYGMDYVQNIFTPRVYEARLRREEPANWADTDKNLVFNAGLDAAENALYLLNPVGRAFRAGAQGIKMGKYLGGVANVADVLANPLLMETIDSNAYGDEDNTDRKDFNNLDVLIGTGINASMNKVMPYLIKNRGKIFAPINKSKAQMLAEEEAKLATKEANKILEDGGSREANETMKDLVQDELRRQDIREAFTSAEDKRLILQDIIEQLSKKKVIEPRKTKYSERLLGDIDDWAVLDYASNKVGDYISEDPKMTRQLLTRTAREYVPFAGQFISDLARDYYNRKDKNVEQDKINRDLKALKLLGGRR